MVEIDAGSYVHLYELWQAGEEVLREIGLPACLGGPDLPPAVNRLIVAIGAVRKDRIASPAEWMQMASESGDDF